jgi:hypothetical protein
MLSPSMIYPDGHVVIAYQNLDPDRKSVIFQDSDGPKLLVPASGFAANYGRVVGLLFLQLCFLAILGCAAGANLSVPVAIFVSFSYVVIGALVTAMQPADPAEAVVPTGLIAQAAELVRQATGHLVVSIADFSRIAPLTKGELVEAMTLLRLFLSPFLLHGLLLAGIGIWCLRHRELGAVIRR